MRRFVQRVLGLFRHGRAERELAREVDSHLALLEEEHVRRGAMPDQARAAARRAMGSVALANDLHRDARSFVWIDDMRQDLRFAARLLVRSPGFAAVVILTKKSHDAPSLNSLISLRAETVRSARAPGRYDVRVHALKDKRAGPGWTHGETCRGPAGVR